MGFNSGFKGLMCFSTEEWIGLSITGAIRKQKIICFPKRMRTNEVTTIEGRDCASQEW